ncbi:hypothetical protein BDB01DRAFT_835329 [Pilobolus umbonatus]|nr:hypothetical protein BDB01DRAFT_835329 [Pilobolus umbonatus]
MSFFPRHNNFFIKSVKTGLVISAYDNDEGDYLVIQPQVETDNAHQLWTYMDGYLFNKRYSFVIDIKGGDLIPGQDIVQFTRKRTMSQNQRWEHRDGFIYAICDPRIVLDLKSKGEETGAYLCSAIKSKESETQQWAVQEFKEPPAAPAVPVAEVTQEVREIEEAE